MLRYVQRLAKSPSFCTAALYLAGAVVWFFLPIDPLWRILDMVIPASPEAVKWFAFVIVSCVILHHVVSWQMSRVTQINGYARRMRYFVRGLIDHCPLPLIVKDEAGVIVLANRPAMSRYLVDRQTIIGKTIQDIFPADVAKRLAANDRIVMETGTAVEDDIDCVVDGKPQMARVVKFPIIDDRSVVKGVGTFSIDMTYSRIIEGKLKRSLLVDDLTGLPNREYVSREIPRLIEEARAAKHELAFMLIEFDGLRRIETTLGHEIADEALVGAVARLRETVGPEPMIAYLRGWDVLVVYPQTAGMRRPAGMARAIVDAFAAPIKLLNNLVFPAPRVGLASFPHDGIDAHTLLKNVRMALGEGVAETTTSFQQCLPGLEKVAHRRLAIETQLRTALDRGEFLLNYQPQIDAKSEQIIGAEALIRWRNPVLGFVSPVEFIPIAEESGLINAIDRWVLETACKEAQSWAAVGGGHIRIAVNVTANQFQSAEFVCFISKVLRETGLQSRRLEIELTERMVLKGGAEVHENLKWLGKLNVHLAIDDFGTGYSSLKTLKSFPFDILKIDKSFVDDVGRPGGDLTIIKSIVDMAKNLGHCIVAEGVETEDQRRTLCNLGVDLIQGYFYSRPISAFEFRQFIRRRATGGAKSAVI